MHILGCKHARILLIKYFKPSNHNLLVALSLLCCYTNNDRTNRFSGLSPPTFQVSRLILPQIQDVEILSDTLPDECRHQARLTVVR